MNRRNIIIILVFTIATFSGGAYWYFFKQPAVITPTVEFPGESDTRISDTAATPTETTSEDTPIFTPGSGATLPRLYELHKLHVAGAGFTETKNKNGYITNITARYIERGLGHIYETQLSTYAESRIVNETRSRLSEALWGNGGRSVVVRSVDDNEGGIIKTHIVNIGASTISFARGTSTEAMSTGFLKTEEVYLPDSIPFMATSEDGADKLFYLEGGAGSTATFKDSGVSKIFSSAFTEWLPQFPNQKLITLTSRPSASVPGHLFFLNTATKAVTKVLGGINGLTTLTNHDGKFLLYSESKGNTPELSIYDITKKEVRKLSIQTLPEKCVWGNKKTTIVYCAVPQVLPNASYPDQWYQGLVSFSDELWEINATTLSVRKIMTPKTLGAHVLDMTNLALSSDDMYLLFMNKVSGTPWVYSIVEPLSPKPLVVPTTIKTSTTTVSQPAVTPDMQKLK